MSNPIPTPAALLARAADILDERGWTQGKYLSNDGCVCTVGALNLATTESTGTPVSSLDATYPDVAPFDPAWRARGDAIRSVSSLSGKVSIPEWNDAKGRTKEEVQALLRRAAESGAE